MPTFVNLITFTEQGVRNYRDTIGRARDYWASIERAGGKVHSEYWTLGEYDIVVVFDAPDDEAAARLNLQLSAQGNVRTTTLRAFNAEEMGRIIEG